MKTLLALLVILKNVCPSVGAFFAYAGIAATIAVFGLPSFGTNVYVGSGFLWLLPMRRKAALSSTARAISYRFAIVVGLFLIDLVVLLGNGPLGHARLYSC